MTKLRLAADIETDGLMPNVSKIWCLVTVNSDSGEVRSFSDYDPDLPSLSEGLQYLSTADIVYGHNFIGYDLPVMAHLLGFRLPATTKVIDTWVLSQMNQYKRDHKHGLEGWGTFFKFPKLEFDSTQFELGYTKEMLTYCIRDVELNVKVYKYLAEEAKKILKINPLYQIGMDIEMEFLALEAEIRNKGWKFNMDGAVKLLSEIEDKMSDISSILEPKIGMRCIKTDGLEVKEPTWRKDGCYTVSTVKHFGYTQESGKLERPIEGPYSRISFEQGKVGQIEVVKDYLYSIGWVPDEWNVEKVNGKFVNKSPKITESSLKLLGPEAMLISEYYTIRSRQGILKGWIDEVNKADGRLHGRMWTIGTPTFRCRHEVVANLPSVDSPYGKDMRSLLQCEPGTSIIGADSSGNQMRGLCHYLNNDEFTNEVINGDVHQRNADVLGTSRKLAKPFLYAFLFGGGAGKLGQILTGTSNTKVGKEALDKFQSSIPGMKQLKERLQKEYERTATAFGKERAFIRGIDGRIVFVSSEHQLLNYLLQTAEGVTCKAAMVYAKKEIEKAKIMAYPIIMYHDEQAWVCKDEYAEQVKEILIESYDKAARQFGITCMGGSGTIGKTYADVH